MFDSVTGNAINCIQQNCIQQNQNPSEYPNGIHDITIQTLLGIKLLSKQSKNTMHDIAIAVKVIDLLSSLIIL